ncbi:MAG: conjugal transfer protein TraE [Candidatus Midichloriaceae bacterium]|jgi:type IV conjugative transfer system protein TraE|nr:conjugal transfer protein TraE [Candidatus Midichloriaceae bacterium]
MMNIAQQVKANQRLRLEKLILGVLSGVLLLSNLGLTWHIVFKETTTIIVPTQINRSFSVGNSGVSEEYLEMVARDLVTQLLNLTSENYEYVENAMLKIAHPSSYWKLRSELEELASDIKLRKVSVAFAITEMRIDKEALQVDVTGNLETRLGTKTIKREIKKYRVIFDYGAYQLALKEFYEVKDDDKLE